MGCQEPKAEEGKSIEYDPSNKESMVSTVVRMAGQLKNIDVQMAILVKDWLVRMCVSPKPKLEAHVVEHSHAEQTVCGIDLWPSRIVFVSSS